MPGLVTTTIKKLGLTVLKDGAEQQQPQINKIVHVQQCSAAAKTKTF